MDALSFISKDALILIPFLYFIGMFLSKQKKIPNSYIPFILLGLSIIFCILLIGLSVQSIIQSVLIAGTTVFTNQLLKQGTNIINNNDTTNNSQ